MKDLAEIYQIKEMAAFLEVSRQGYYAWLKQPARARKQDDAILKEKIVAIFDNSHKTYGAIRVAKALHAENTC